MRGPFELSVVVPVLDEEEAIRALLADLAAQREVVLEVVLCDGGSNDGTVRVAGKAAGEVGLTLTLVRSGGGRGRQLNAGVPATRAETLLFLHADSRFGDPLALRRGLDALAAATRDHDRSAGRFGLRFDRSAPGADLGYYFHECKARLDRPGCIHGDQGLLVRRTLFDRVGPFPETVPMLAETRFAGAVRREASWLLLPAEIHTSARRFEEEGPAERRTLNAIIMNLDAVGQEGLLAALPELYRHRGEAGPARHGAVLAGIARWIAAMPPAERRAFWRDTGACVRDNAWQLAYLLDVRRAFRRGLSPGGETHRSLRRFDRWVYPLINSWIGALIASLLTRLWFRQIVRAACRRAGSRVD